MTTLNHHAVNIERRLGIGRRIRDGRCEVGRWRWGGGGVFRWVLGSVQQLPGHAALMWGTPTTRANASGQTAAELEEGVETFDIKLVGDGGIEEWVAASPATTLAQLASQWEREHGARIQQFSMGGQPLGDAALSLAQHGIAEDAVLHIHERCPSPSATQWDWDSAVRRLAEEWDRPSATCFAEVAALRQCDNSGDALLGAIQRLYDATVAELDARPGASAPTEAVLWRANRISSMHESTFRRPPFLVMFLVMSHQKVYEWCRADRKAMLALLLAIIHMQLTVDVEFESEAAVDFQARTPNSVWSNSAWSLLVRIVEHLPDLAKSGGIVFHVSGATSWAAAEKFVDIIKDEMPELPDASIRRASNPYSRF